MAQRKLSLITIKERLYESLNTQEAYRPFLRVSDFGSQGESARIFGKTVKREHHLFSLLEQNYFLFFDLHPCVIDIREQFPLVPLGETIQIARWLGIDHPRERVRKYPVYMTTDFLLTLKRKDQIEELAVCVKTREDFNKSRTQEKLMIEKEYWKRHQVPWVILLDDSLNPVLVHNLNSLNKLPPITQEIREDMKEMEELIRSNPECPLNSLFSYYEKRNTKTNGYGHFLFKHLLREGILTVDLTKEIPFNEAYHEDKRDLPFYSNEH